MPNSVLRSPTVKILAVINRISDRLRLWEFWRRQLIRPTSGYRTTWKLRLLLSILLLALTVASRQWWAPLLGQSLVSNIPIEKSDFILIDNLDTNYLLFEKARDLDREGRGAPVLVPVSASRSDPELPNWVSREFAEVMIRAAQIHTFIIIPFKEEEPITLNMARQVGNYLWESNAKTVLILTSGFKSKRIHLIFTKVLSQAGIEIYCLPVWGSHRPENWAASWHGIQEVLLQHAKLAYYRMWVL